MNPSSATMDGEPKAQYIKTDASGIAGHPRGLMTLFFTEMWERFSYYGMRALLILYMTAAASGGGLGYSDAESASLYGTYTAAVYFVALPGGWIADNFLGARLSVLIGGIIIALGHFSMAIHSINCFYAGLVLIVIGTGFLKPNISSMVGSLYGEGDPRRDGGFSIFYMGINLGAFISPLVCGYLAQSDGFKAMLASHGFNPANSWHWGFGAAGVGMTLGLIQYLWGYKKLPDLMKQKKDAAAASQGHVEPLTGDDYKRISVIFILFMFSVIFWAAFEQAGSSLNLFADRLTQNSIFGWSFPSSWFQSVNSIFIIALAPLFSVVWIKMGSKQPSSPAKFGIGLLFAGLGFIVVAYASSLTGNSTNVTKVGPSWLIIVYLLHTIGELCLSPVGLSTVTKLAPARLVGLMMGVWFLSISFGNKVAGAVAGLFDEKAEGALVKLFGAVAVVTIVASLILFALTPQIRKLMRGVK